MKHIPAKTAIDEFGDLVSATDDFKFPCLWNFYCFHCNSLVELVLAQGDQPAYFIHNPEHLTETALAICPNIDRSPSA